VKKAEFEMKAGVRREVEHGLTAFDQNFDFNIHRGQAAFGETFKLTLGEVLQFEARLNNI
jgi:hypothetical protein